MWPSTASGSNTVCSLIVWRPSKSQQINGLAKASDIVGLYLNPPERALVLSVEESQIKALDRTQPGLQKKPGRCGTMAHVYKRHGTTTLFAALNILDGKVIGERLPRHRSRIYQISENH